MIFICVEIVSKIKFEKARKEYYQKDLKSKFKLSEKQS